MKTVAVIMAGGKGERFWPKSRMSFPKQFLSLTNDGKTLIQSTVERLLPLISIEDIFIVTNKNYTSLVKEQLPTIPLENIIAEPIARNTAPCIALAATILEKKYGDAIMMILPSDHLIKHEKMYLTTLETAKEVAMKGDNLVTIGITPTYPETGYGYIKYGNSIKDSNLTNVYRVDKFVEKPNLELAKEYLSSGNYIWNSGMFVWKISTIMNKFKEFIPETYNNINIIKNSIGIEEFEIVLSDIYPKLKSESIDYAIMEKAKNIYTIPCTFGWDDVGSWLSIEKINKANEHGNVVIGNAITIDTKNTTISGSEKLIATLGIEDIIIVDTQDVILICSKHSTQDVKKILENLRNCNRTEYI